MIIREKWVQERVHLSSIEQDVFEAIAMLCPSEKEMPKGLEKLTSTQSKSTQSIKALQGTWTLDEERIFEEGRFKELPYPMQASTQGILKALQVKIVFEADRIRLVTQAWDHEDVVSISYQLVSHLDDIIVLALAGQNDQVSLRVQVEDKRLQIIQGDTQWFLRQVTL